LRCRDEAGPAILFQLLIYPGTDLRGKYPSHDENAQGYFLTRDSQDWFCSLYLRDDHDRDHPWASPALAPDLSNLPPALVITAEFDPLRDEGTEYADRLRKAGVSARASCYSGAIHGFFGASTEIGRAALSEASAALGGALYPNFTSNTEFR
jgi:acetyl esterase